MWLGILAPCRLTQVLNVGKCLPGVKVAGARLHGHHSQGHGTGTCRVACCCWLTNSVGNRRIMTQRDNEPKGDMLKHSEGQIAESRSSCLGRAGNWLANLHLLLLCMCFLRSSACSSC